MSRWAVPFVSERAACASLARDPVIDMVLGPQVVSPISDPQQPTVSLDRLLEH